jgi:hypothetical protein
MHTTFQLENVKESDCFEDLGIHGRILLKWILKKRGARAWTEFIWLRAGTSSGFL